LNQKASTVYLVGAGPGDPDLITVKGADLLERCDVLVYDSLVPPELVLRSPAQERHYVGKTTGGHAMPQEEITALLVRLAMADGPSRIIVRLKGGDPYVFGRGGEEAQACVDAGVPVQVVPGVTSGVAAPAYAGVPVTHRDHSRGAIFVTGHRAKDRQLDLPWELLANSSLTLVFYMGVSTLPDIAAQLQAHGMPADTPALTVQEGTLPGQRQVTGRLDRIATLAREAGIRPPALTVVGGVAGLSAQLFQQQPRPLAGKTVVLVRAEERHYPDVGRLRAAGARVADLPGIRCQPRFEDADVANMVRAIQDDDALLFTSVLAVDFFAQLWRDHWGRAEDPPQPTIAAAARSIARALARHDLPADITPDRTAAGQSLQALQAYGLPPGTRIWLPRSAKADAELPQALAEAGYRPRPVPLYDTLPVPITRDVRSMLVQDRVDAILFLAGTCVQSVLDAVPELTQREEGHMLVAAIGPKTAEVAAARGLACKIVPPRPTLTSLVDAVADALATGSTS